MILIRSYLLLLLSISLAGADITISEDDVHFRSGKPKLVSRGNSKPLLITFSDEEGFSALSGKSPLKVTNVRGFLGKVTEKSLYYFFKAGGYLSATQNSDDSLFIYAWMRGGFFKGRFVPGSVKERRVKPKRKVESAALHISSPEHILRLQQMLMKKKPRKTRCFEQGNCMGDVYLRKSS